MEVVDDIFFFYFDIIGATGRFLKNPAQELANLENFQRLVRERSSISAPGSLLVTVSDNVMARIVDAEAAALPEVVESTINAADECGITDYFGAITAGSWKRDFSNDTLHGTGTNITRQHVGLLSDPYLRAVLTEKWSAGLHKAGRLPHPSPCIWLSEEVSRDHFHGLQGLKFGGTFDLKTLPLPGGKAWNFGQSKFTPLYV